MWLNLLLLVLVLKNELENYPYRLTDYLLTPITYKHSILVTNKLASVLRNDITLLVDNRSTSLFRHFVQNLRGLVKINRIDGKLKYEEIRSYNYLNKDRTLFFVDNESLIYYPKLKEEGFNVVHYTNKLVDDSFCDLLIDSYNKIKNLDLNIQYYEFNILTYIDKWYKETCIRHHSMGSIHNILYNNYNTLYNRLEEDFNLFLINKKLINKKMYEVADEYIKIVVEYLYKIGILLTDNSYIPGLVECIFPFVFTNNLSVRYTGDLIVTGGVCLDKIDQEFGYLFDMRKVDEYCKNGKRFIFSYYCKIKDNHITVTRIK
jgi:hypothetical protein